MIRSRVRAAVLAAVLATLLAGCGSDSDPDPSAPEGADTPGTPSVTAPGGVAGSPSTPGTEPVPDGDTMSPVATALITPDTYETILREVVTIANDETLDAASDRARPILDGFGPLLRRAIDTGAASGEGLDFVSYEPTSEDNVAGDFTFACANGGTLVLDAFDAAAVGGAIASSMTATGPCAVGDVAYEGYAFSPPTIVRASLLRTFEDFSIARADGDSSTLDGEYLDTLPGTNVPTFERGWSEASLVTVDGGETTRVEGYASNRSGFAPLPGQAGELRASATAAFSVTAPWSSNETLEVAVELSHAAPTDASDGLAEVPGQWSAGTLRVRAPDGSGLTLSPETDDPATFSVTFDDDGSDDPIVREWADGFQVTCPAPFDCR